MPEITAAAPRAYAGSSATTTLPANGKATDNKRSALIGMAPILQANAGPGNYGLGCVGQRPRVDCRPGNPPPCTPTAIRPAGPVPVSPCRPVFCVVLSLLSFRSVFGVVVVC